MIPLQRILLLENDVKFARALRDGLKETFPSVQVAFDLAAAIGEIESSNPDFLVADTAAVPELRIPSFCRKIRDISAFVPLLLFSEHARPIDKARALDAGADAYLEKPLNVQELSALMQAIWRRAVADPPDREASLTAKVVEYPGLFVNLSNYTVVQDGRSVEMPPRELELLYFLAKSPNRVYTREQLLDHVWGYDFAGDARTVDVHVKRIRKKIKDHATWSLDTVWGVGYKFSAHPTRSASDCLASASRKSPPGEAPRTARSRRNCSN